jgi:hypothetical protein
VRRGRGVWLGILPADGVPTRAVSHRISEACTWRSHFCPPSLGSPKTSSNNRVTRSTLSWSIGAHKMPFDLMAFYEKVVYMYLVVGSISIAGGVVVLAMYWSNPALRAHPSPIIFYVTVCEMFLALKFWVGAVVYTSGHRGDVAASFNFIDDDCTSSALYGQVRRVG